SGVYLVNFDSVVSVKIDDRAIVGNIYGYSHVSATAIYLEKGAHMLYVCAIMDVRMFGGAVPPKIKFSGKFERIDVDSASHGITVIPGDAIVPDLMDGRLATEYMSITVLNADITGQEVMTEEGSIDTLDGEPPPYHEPGWVQILDVRAYTDDGAQVKVGIPVIFSLKLAPGQVYPLPVELDFEIQSDGPAAFALNLQLDLVDLDTLEHFSIPAGRYELRRRTWGEVYKITFLDYDKI
ncbi:hypothetical protein HK405_002635, partial [Cladochytrium tenue]